MHTPGLREAKKAATRTALSRTMVRLATANGIEHVTIDAVAAEAGVSVRTFHNYFSSKEDALLHYVSSLFDAIVDRIAARPPDESFWCSVRTAIIEGATSPEVGEPSEIVAMLRLLDTEPTLTAASRDVELGDTVEARLAQLCEQRGQRVNALYPQLVLRTAISTACTALEFWVASSKDDPHGIDLEAVLESAFDQVGHGLAHPLDGIRNVPDTPPPGPATLTTSSHTPSPHTPSSKEF